MSAESNAVEATLRELVELRIPLGHPHTATARVVTACLAAELGFDIDTIDDLRLGVDEAVSVLADGADGAAGDPDRAILRFEISENMMQISVARDGARPPITRDDVDALALRVLDAIADRFDITDDGTLVISKRVSIGDGG